MLTHTPETTTAATLPHPAFRVGLAALPLVSFALQYGFSAASGTLPAMMRHSTVVWVDWTLVPFNYFVACHIDWRRGRALLGIAILAVVANIAAHAYWQANGLDPGHMIAPNGATLPAGWVHLGFSIVEMILLAGFVFAPAPAAPGRGLAVVCGVLYFVAMAASGYHMHGRAILSDTVVLLSGLFFMLLFPRVKRSRTALRD